jgi:hemoglobin
VAETLYQHAGGDEALHRLEELFYKKVLTDPVLKTLFTTHGPKRTPTFTRFAKYRNGSGQRK